VVTQCARVVVVAISGVGEELTTALGNAGVVCADVAIVTGQGGAAYAAPLSAGVDSTAGVAVVARQFVVHMLAAVGGLAGVVGAEVAVVAVGLHAPCTKPLITYFTNGTGVFVVAGETVAGGDDATFAISRIACGHVAESVEALRFWTDNFSSGLHDADVG